MKAAGAYHSIIKQLLFHAVFWCKEGCDVQWYLFTSCFAYFRCLGCCCKFLPDPAKYDTKCVANQSQTKDRPQRDEARFHTYANTYIPGPHADRGPAMHGSFLFGSERGCPHKPVGPRLDFQVTISFLPLVHAQSSQPLVDLGPAMHGSLLSCLERECPEKPV